MENALVRCDRSAPCGWFCRHPRRSRPLDERRRVGSRTDSSSATALRAASSPRSQPPFLSRRSRSWRSSAEPKVPMTSRSARSSGRRSCSRRSRWPSSASPPSSSPRGASARPRAAGAHADPQARPPRVPRVPRVPRASRGQRYCSDWVPDPRFVCWQRWRLCWHMWATSP